MTSNLKFTGTIIFISLLGIGCKKELGISSKDENHPIRVSGDEIIQIREKRGADISKKKEVNLIFNNPTILNKAFTAYSLYSNPKKSYPNVEAFKKALTDHVKNTNNQQFKRKRSKGLVTHYFDYKTMLDVIVDHKGNLVAAKILTDQEVRKLYRGEDL